MKQLYLIDLDRTIFNTRQFAHDIVEHFAKDHNLDRSKYAATVENYMDPQSGGYDPHSHHRELLGIQPDRFDEIITTAFAGRDYAFPDASAWMKQHASADMVIMTSGFESYQTLKYNHAACAAGVRLIVVARNKGLVLRQYLETGTSDYALGFLSDPDQSITLIDDAAQTFTALGSTGKITGIRIARTGERYSTIPAPDFVRQIHSFGEL